MNEWHGRYYIQLFIVNLVFLTSQNRQRRDRERRQQQTQANMQVLTKTQKNRERDRQRLLKKWQKQFGKQMQENRSRAPQRTRYMLYI